MFTQKLNEYRKIVQNVDALIKASGYRTTYVYEQMGMDKTSFYYRRKNHSFSLDEMEKLLNIIRADELEDKVLAQLSIEDQKEGIMSENEKRAWLDAS